MTPELRMTRARTRLLLEQPFFGTLAMRLRIVQEPSIPTMDVDGVTLRYSPAFLDTLSDPELIGVLAHETMHCALLHPYRRGSKDPQQWNIAADYAINQTITDCGLTLPADALLDPQYKDMSADQIYSKLGSQPKPQVGNGQGQGQGQGSSTGTFSDAPSPSAKDPGGNDPGSGNQSSGGQDSADSEQSGSDPSPDPGMTETDWAIAAEQAAMTSRKAGKLPAGADRSIKQARQSSTDWRAILKDFISATCPADYSWSHPNRRYVANGLYLPGTIKENTGVFVIAVDTSGSVDQRMLECFAAELNQIMQEAKPEKLHVVYCDSRVAGNEDFGQGDEIQLHAKGGGGTSFQPVFDWTEGKIEQGEIQDLKAMIYLTDLDSSDRPKDPGYPVLWVTPLWVNRQQPFGDLIKVDTDSA